MKKIIPLLLILLLTIGIVVAPPIMPPPPGGIIPVDPVEEDLFTLVGEHSPSNPNQIDLITFYADYRDSGNNPITDATCTLDLDDAASVSMNYNVSSNNRYTYTSLDDHIIGTHAYDVSCGTLTASNSYVLTEEDLGFTVVTSISPSTLFDEDNLTFIVNFEQNDVPIETPCSITVQPYPSGTAFGASTVFNSVTQRHELEFDAEGFGPGDYIYGVTCWLPPTQYPTLSIGNFTVYDRATAQILDISHSPADPADDETVEFRADYYNGYDQPFIANCTLTYDSLELGLMLFNVSGNNHHTYQISNLDEGTYTYSVQCDDIEESAQITVDHYTPPGGGGGNGGGSNSYYPPPVVCTPDWSCSDWGPCAGGFHTRSCEDINTCDDDSEMPVISELCTATCFDDFKNGDEDGVDCGGSCTACASNTDGPVIDYSQVKPQFVKQPIMVTPGEPVTIELFNDGLELYDSLKLIVGDTTVMFNDALHPGDHKLVEVDIPMNILLIQPELSVYLFYNDVALDSGVLTIDVQWPEYGVFLDATNDEPRFYFIVDNTQSETARTGLEANVQLFFEGEETYFDVLGPYNVEANSRLVKSVTVPDYYLNKGDLEVRATFYEKGEYVTETAGFFTSNVGDKFNYMPILIIVFTVLGIGILFVGMDMAYNKRNFKDEWDSFRRKS